MTTDTAQEAPKTTEYVALANLSISRAHSARHRGLGDDRMADRVEAGEKVRLTDDEAHGFLSRHRVPVIRKATEKDSGRRVLARDLFGRRTPAPATDKLVNVTESTRLIQAGEPDPALSPEGNAPDPSVVDPDADGEGARSTVRGRSAKAS
jgi:hypothetical protein